MVTRIGKKTWLKARVKYDPNAWNRARSNPHRHQKLYSSLFRTLRARLNLTPSDAAKLFGVSPLTYHRWERPDGCHPRKSRMKRLRDLWILSKKARTDAFNQDREEAVDFS